jgi:hypothetical protein
MAGIKKAEAEKKGGLDKKTMKRIFYGSNILLVGMAFFILLIMFFVSWDFIGKTERLVKKSATDACSTLTGVESMLVHTQEEVLLLQGTVDGMDESLTSLSDGLEEAGSAMRTLDDALGALSTFGISLGEEIGNTADSLEDASVSLGNTTAGLSEHKEKISEISDDLGDIRASVSSQKQTLCDQTNITEIFDSMKLTVIILFLLAAALIFIPFINSAAGMM